MTKPIKALIFDFDGLLVDTETPAYESWRAVYAEHGLDLPIELWKDALGTAHGFDALEHLAVQIGSGFDRAGARERRQAQKQQLSAQQPLLPGVLTILDEAQALGLPCAVASSSGRAWVEGWLAHHRIRTRFVCVRTADDVARTKPDPALFLAAAACLGVAPAECLVFEDSPNGIHAAHAAGMRCVAVPGAISRQVPLPPAELILERLDTLGLREVLRLAEAKRVVENKAFAPIAPNQS
jgi:HAD superfamily hydrolase (TIGR01509 family)